MGSPGKGGSIDFAGPGDAPRREGEMGMRFLGLIVVLTMLAGQDTRAETLLERAERDGIAYVAKDDAEMAAAMRKAREGLGGFLKLARSPRPTMRGFAVKVAITEGDEIEFFWIAPFTQRKTEFSGEINNEPQLVKNVKLGQTITFKEDEIVDWLYQERGLMRGNFTACVLLKREPPEEAEEFRKELGLRCDP
jgi:uncharacterized protein YegJ (DUF2314 family)